ncbi:NUDIX hydrolase [Paenibacillus wulumuqiensis]|uniref:NUDIX hydrolase n=1 Tax=Paenibacillus wulumuqiensis TaxID=1567107 RepID=UPI0006190D09|nr:NUDIX hydrolase [Paenibacillus wulumuqiensis]
MQLKWLEWAKQIQAISQAGLEYSRDVYDLERFQQLRELSVEIMQQYTEAEIELIHDLFAGETGYATPKVDIRAVVFQENRILMVREKLDGAWALPGGWADIGLSPKEIAVKEVKEESGYDVRAGRLLGVVDKKFHPHPPSPWHVYKFFIECELIGGTAATDTTETMEVGFFAEDELPPLSVERNTEQQIRTAFSYLHNPGLPVFCD